MRLAPLRRAHLLSWIEAASSPRPIVCGQRGGVRGRSASARPVDLAGQLGRPVGHRAVTKAHRGVQRADLRGELVLRRGQLGGLPGQRQDLAEAALGGGHA